VSGYHNLLASLNATDGPDLALLDLAHFKCAKASEYYAVTSGESFSNTVQDCIQCSVTG
jgi:hypothetical protein